MSCRSLEKKENRTHHNSILFGVLHVYTVTHVMGRCTTTLHHRFRAVYPCLDKIFWKLLKLNTSPSKPLKYSVKDSEFKQSMSSHATCFDGEPSRLKLIVDISVLFALLQQRYTTRNRFSQLRFFPFGSLNKSNYKFMST